MLLIVNVASQWYVVEIVIYKSQDLDTSLEDLMTLVCQVKTAFASSIIILNFLNLFNLMQWSHQFKLYRIGRVVPEVQGSRCVSFSWLQSLH